MLENLTGGLRRGTRTFGQFTAGQKAVTILGIIALVVGGVFFSSWVGKPTYAPLFSNLSSTDASAIVDKLNAAGTPYQLTDGGNTILVPQDKVYATRLTMSGQGLPASDQTGYALLDKQGITASDFQQQVAYQRALEGELTKTINSISGVKGSIVHLAIPQQTVFTSDTAKPTASVLIDTMPGTTLSPTQVQAVVNLVASSVQGMTPDQVTVADSAGTVLAAPGTNGVTGAAADSRTQQTQTYQNAMASSLQAMVDRLVGPGHSVVKVTAALDFDTTETKTQTYLYDPKGVPLSDSSTTETYSGSGTAAGGVLGTTTIPSTATGAGANKYSKTSVTRDNSVGTKIEDRKSAAGAVKTVNVGILLDAATAKGVNVQQLTALVTSAAGLQTARGDTVNITSLPFDTTAAAATKKEAAAAAAAQSTAGIIGMAKTGGLALLVLVVLVLSFLSSKKSRKPLDEAEIARIEELQRELSAASGHTRSIDGASGRMELTGPTPVDPLAERMAAVRDEIGVLVERQPEEVAQLLRGWLADRRG